MLIVDETLAPLSPGEVGEIAVRSDFLSPGYWRDPELTAKRFVADPEGGAKLVYLTGDLGRASPDGQLLVMGRVDQQVKVHGYRVEAGEVEGALMAMEGIDEAAVVGLPDAVGEIKLVGYVASRSGHAGGAGLSDRAIRQALGQTLPSYMVPTTIVHMDALPRNVNGKVDRKALPRPEPPRMVTERAYAPPETPLQTELCRMWQEALGAARVGLDDTFASLGGDSLAALHFVLQVDQELNRRLPAAVLLAYGTVRELSQWLETHEADQPPSTIVPLQPLGDRLPLYLAHNHMGMHLVFTELTPLLGEDQPLYGIQPPWLESLDEMPEDVHEIAATYVRALRQFQPHGPYLLGSYCGGRTIAFEMALQLLDAGEAVPLLALFDVGPPLPARHRREAVGAFLRDFIRFFPDWLRYHPGRSFAEVLRAARRRLRWPAYIAKSRGSLAVRLAYAQRNTVAGWTSAMEQLYQRLNGADDVYRHDGAPRHSVRVVAFVARGRRLFGPYRQAETWRQLAPDVRFYPVPGNHSSFLSQPHVAELALRLREVLDEVQEEPVESSTGIGEDARE